MKTNKLKLSIGLVAAVMAGLLVVALCEKISQCLTGPYAPANE